MWGIGGTGAEKLYAQVGAYPARGLAYPACVPGDRAGIPGVCCALIPGGVCGAQGIDNVEQLRAGGEPLYKKLGLSNQALVGLRASPPLPSPDARRTAVNTDGAARHCAAILAL